MTLAQQLVDLENQKKDLDKQKELLLEKSRLDAVNSYFCIMRVYPVGKGSRDSEFNYFSRTISFQIVGLDNTNQKQLFSFEFLTHVDINLKSSPTATLSYYFNNSIMSKDSTSYVDFFLNNFNDLNSDSRTSYIDKIQSAYEKMQDPDDDRYLQRLEVRNMVGYLKSTDLTLLEFGKEINQQIKNIVETHLDSFIYKSKKKQWFEKVEENTTYQLSDTEKNNLIKDIKKKLLHSIKNDLVLCNVRKESGYGTSNEWDVKHNNTVNYFNKRDQQIVNARKQNTKVAVKKPKLK